nr:uncharacterized protein LOC111503213 [Leptinotarsa decemlineata]
MGVLSKEIFDKHNDVNCDVFHIWTSSCWNANFSTYFMWNVIVGSSRFLLRIYLLKMFLSIGKKDMKTIILNFLVSEMRSTMYSTAMGVLMLAAICSFRLIFGRIHYFTLLFLPGCVSGLSLLVESKSNQVLHSLLYFNLVIETILRKSKISWEWETVIFMSVSGLLMHFLTNRHDKIDFIHFWFYTPPVKDGNCEKYLTTCSHDKTCPVFVYQGFWKYFVLGYGVSIIKKLLTRMGSIVKEPSTILRMCFNRSNLYFGSFIGSYVAINRMLSCYLPKTRMSETFHGLIAGLISGLTYAISPNIHVLVIAITTLLQISYNNISKHLKITNHYWNRLVIYVLCQGYLIHHKFCYPKACAPYYSKMIDACTNNVTVDVCKHFIKTFSL